MPLAGFGVDLEAVMAAKFVLLMPAALQIVVLIFLQVLKRGHFPCLLDLFS